ncbi:hypothetical protein [Pseudoalteromonas phenolica]|uniref:Uncharacterized protein n=1 Tax=Pseudoalteromonas phenolica TaxID=161398 RepID=A0A0S2JX47_9GAMM|nr:hypothetical protein [Pseudoalteromonas phenolica]ALO40636.1 hypothetical protein PP2015_108 [Pseudoalteromonas phenolica]MBE0354852.1 hypothetical protein [Pseudoalteromonas phenolica O-BC30]RXF01386.1 hypothetical protein D9981_09055 [Pseudoalteromonas phenolica O-BC30]
MLKLKKQKLKELSNKTLGLNATRNIAAGFALDGSSDDDAYISGVPKKFVGENDQPFFCASGKGC